MVLLAFILGVTVAWLAFFREEPEPPRRTGELRQSRGMLTNPLLECEVFEERELRTLQPFRYKVKALLQEKLDAGIISEGSVYFRDLNNGLWFGINEQVRYHPASLLKVPIMIACLKEAEKDPGLLSREVTYKGDFDLERWQGVAPSSGLVQGQSYTVDELLVRMVSRSDNNAAQLLVNLIGDAAWNQVLHDLDVNVNSALPEHYVSLHGYAGFFRVLFNASYLNREFSEKALKILTESEFRDGLRAGLPPGQLAAAKFGESGVGADPDVVQLHEIGIVYYPGRPYLLGIMTRGRRGSDMSSMLRDISRLVYEAVASQSVPPAPPAAKVFN